MKDIVCTPFSLFMDLTTGHVHVRAQRHEQDSYATFQASRSLHGLPSEALVNVFSTTCYEPEPQAPAPETQIQCAKPQILNLKLRTVCVNTVGDC